MAQKIANDKFRSVFKTIDRDVLRWFPGHMGKGLKQMQQKLRSVDCIIEVHDARIPFSGRNADFKYTISGVKPHILVLNKADLIEKNLQPRIVDRLESDYPHVVFTNCKDHSCRGVKKIFPLAQELIGNSNRYNREAEDNYNIMVIGVPNVGKSSLVNALRARHLNKGKASPVGANAGITRSVLHKIKMCDKPLFYMLDTPGILTPNIPDIDIGLKLALCATIQDHLVGETIIADYLLFWLNRHKHFEYVSHFNLPNSTDDILDVLAHISKEFKKVLRVRTPLNEYVLRPNLEAAAHIFLKSFRDGSLGKYMLDESLL
ncbi:mitochondrial GTPase 1 [Anthonomus grandis grandis]|uniref:mitochondrial GTPase 1 n=1 Tax=Anthonomus grandis grandis TaxID=2921223 RepID=UPI00216538C1|nr:mitochondrial GTPase 1 [Anthonomus grandis grandis]